MQANDIYNEKTKNPSKIFVAFDPLSQKKIWSNSADPTPERRGPQPGEKVLPGRTRGGGGGRVPSGLRTPLGATEGADGESRDPGYWVAREPAAGHRRQPGRSKHSTAPPHLSQANNKNILWPHTGFCLSTLGGRLAGHCTSHLTKATVRWRQSPWSGTAIRAMCPWAGLGAWVLGRISPVLNSALR